MALSDSIFIQYNSHISTKDFLNKVNNTYVAISDPIIYKYNEPLSASEFL